MLGHSVPEAGLLIPSPMSSPWEEAERRCEARIRELESENARLRAAAPGEALAGGGPAVERGGRAGP